VIAKTLLGLFICLGLVHAKDYTQDPKTVAFIEHMAARYNFKPSYLNRLFKDVEVQSYSLKFFLKRSQITPQKRKKLDRLYPVHGAWDRYTKYILTPKRIEDGQAFLKRNKHYFNMAEKRFGVPKEYLAAIIGVETAFGLNVGKHPVFDTLTTLAFEPNRRNRFFKRELEHFILLSYRQGFNPKKVMGSYSGAIGLGQFMPSNYEAYGIDHNGDGKIRMQQSGDAIASIANYLKQNGWRKGEEVATRVSYEGERFTQYKTGYNRLYRRSQLKGIKPKQGRWNYHGKVRLIKLSRKEYDELWYGAKNFYVLTRYNHSAYYAMAVHQLAQKLKR
jgi:membrane-bound lytic murein transglycosylase B